MPFSVTFSFQSSCISKAISAINLIDRSEKTKKNMTFYPDLDHLDCQLLQTSIIHKLTITNRFFLFRASVRHDFFFSAWCTAWGSQERSGPAPSSGVKHQKSDDQSPTGHSYRAGKPSLFVKQLWPVRNHKMFVLSLFWGHLIHFCFK